MTMFWLYHQRRSLSSLPLPTILPHKAFPRVILLLLGVQLFSAARANKEYPRHCHHLLETEGRVKSGIYTIDPDGEGGVDPFQVFCNVRTRQDDVDITTVINHQLEPKTTVKGAEAPGSHIQNVTYDYNVTEAQLVALINASNNCEQYISWQCKGAMFGFWYPPETDTWWVGRSWQPQFYWGGAATDSRTCMCHPYCHSYTNNATCNCDSNEKTEWLQDDGLLLDRDRLPVLQLRIGDTGQHNEVGQYTLGPLKCRFVTFKDASPNKVTAPVKLASPKFPRYYPPPFHRYHWDVLVQEGRSFEIVFPTYDLLHWGAYLSVPGCESVLRLVVRSANHPEPITIESQRVSPPYFVSDGSRTTIRVTMVTCNQMETVTHRGFEAEFRETDCAGCRPGLGEAGGETTCTDQCGIIASYRYPYPHHDYNPPSGLYNHSWIIIPNTRHKGIQLTFNDFDIPGTPGDRTCTPERGMLSAYAGTRNGSQKLIGHYCNFNKETYLYSKGSPMRLFYTAKLELVGNGRGFHATYEAIPKKIVPKAVENLKNVAFGKPAQQSSVLENQGPHLAVDGITNEIVSSAASCITTTFENEPWWRVDLQTRYVIHGVKIYNRNTKSATPPTLLTWPQGRYGLPMPRSGCPSTPVTQWEKGMRYHDIECPIAKDETLKHWSNGIQLKGGLQELRGVEQHFCMKTNDTPSSEPQWMPGQYCIFRYGDHCPQGFRTGYIRWPGRGSGNENHAEGTLPDGEYSNQTLVHFCCRGDGEIDKPIRLPTGNPFYLLKYGEDCQKVEGMNPRMHFFHFCENQTADETNQLFFKKPYPQVDIKTFEKGFSLYYCYYDISTSLRGFRVLVDSHGYITTWTRFWDNKQYGIAHIAQEKFGEAYTCIHHPVTETELAVVHKNCTQPVTGQYVTLYVYDRYDSLQVCEVEIYGTEVCGQPLGMAAEEIIDWQISATSSSDPHLYHPTNGRLNHRFGWCSNPDDELMAIQIDLGNMTKIIGLVTQGLSTQASHLTYVKEFSLAFSTDNVTWWFEQVPVGQKKTYKCYQCNSVDFTNDQKITYNLMKPTEARFLRFSILDFEENPCVRLEFIGCRGKDQCGGDYSTPSGTITSPNYPYYYGQDRSCWWTITPTLGKHVHLIFYIVELADQEPLAVAGDCHDNLTVYPEINKTIQSNDGKNFPRSIISNGKLQINLESCFRSTVTRKRGFYANYSFVDCPGCGMGDYSCAEVHMCSSQCGTIMSAGYPESYASNHRCRWHIRVDPAHYINITVEDFDVIGGPNCEDDFVDVYDGEAVVKASLIGRYCNERNPPQHIVSSWNTLFIEFSSGAGTTAPSGRGFRFRYEAVQYQLPTSLRDIHFDDEDMCLAPWKYYNGNCYVLFEAPGALQWYAAEAHCQKLGSHLVSVIDQQEVTVLHHFMSNVWELNRNRPARIYIGLTDDSSEGRFRWTDGNPMSYADWAMPRRNEDEVHQPDGGQYEDCTMIRLDNIHSTSNWHDIPCSLDSTSGIGAYICKKRSPNAEHLNLTLEEWTVEDDSIYDDDYQNIPSTLIHFKCHSLEVVGITVVCDGRMDCADGSDEIDCGPPCPESSFTCNNGRCISISKYCDFKSDCGDGSDEAFCVYAKCDTSEHFQCKNGQCIDKLKRCNLFLDCKDGSDEMSCSGKCQANMTFQCYDGTCIPRSTFCDGYFDCPGFHHEDERVNFCASGIRQQDEHCKEVARRRTCHELYFLDRVPLPGMYEVDPDGNGPLMPYTVECQMSKDGERVWTLVHHDTESRMFVREAVEGPGNYQRNLVYDDASWKQIAALINISSQCRQHVQWQCKGAGFHFNHDPPTSWWVGRHRIPHFYWGDATMDRTCGCFPHCVHNLSCNCDADTILEWKEDAGYIHNQSALPVIQVHFGNTHKTGRAGFHTIGPLECTGVVGGARRRECGYIHDWIWCENGMKVDTKWRCLYEFDENGYLLGCRDASHLRNCDNIQCPQLYHKCPGSYCIPYRYRCNGLWDCPGGYDEMHCDGYTCPGQYHCINQTYCLPTTQLCDGIQHCENGDDETLCEVVKLGCPSMCKCAGLFMSCGEQNLTLVPETALDLRKLNLSYNKFSDVDPTVRNFTYLGELLLSHNRIQALQSDVFKGLKNLYRLDLSFNELTVIHTGAFLGLGNLKTLDLEGNAGLKILETGAFEGLTSLPHLSVTEGKIFHLEEGVFTGLHSLVVLNLSRNDISTVQDGAFHDLTHVEKLDLHGNTIKEFSKGIFQGLESMNSLITDSYKFCCLAQPQVQVEFCLPRADEFSSCKDLMSNLVLRVFLWALGIVALIGNLVVVIWRSRVKDVNVVSSSLILSLGCADYLMGVYLIIVASVDTHYRGDYIAHSDNWRDSALCKAAGFLSTLSSEVSVFTLTFITLERLVCIAFPLSTKRFTPECTRMLIVSSWILAAVLAGLPLVVDRYFYGKFYARSGVCLALHITNQKPSGWEYSVLVFFGINLLAFLVIFAAYAYMYASIRQASRTMSCTLARKASEAKVGRQMALIVLTNFCCWMPIILMGLCAMAGLSIPGEVYAWTAVFILPLNSATNPIVYTLSSVQFKAMILRKFNNSKLRRSLSMSQMQSCMTTRTRNGRYIRTYRPPRGYSSLVHFLRTAAPLHITDVLEIARGLCEALAELHEAGLALGGFEMDYIFVYKADTGTVSVYLPDINAYQTLCPAANLHSEDTAKDMEDFGKIVKKMLQIYHVTCRQGEPVHNSTPH